MSQQIRFIIEKLNESPFSRHYNLVSFDAVDSFNLLQLLNDILAEISSEHKLDLRQEAPEQTAVRLFSFLRVLKYKPSVDLNSFRQGLLQGDKQITYSLMQWLLEKMPELKKRAYLAKYLVRIEVPAEFQQDDQMIELNTTHEELVEQFKELHKTVEQQRSSKFNVSEVRKDINAMEEEKAQLEKRIERLKQKAMATPNSSAMLEVARKLRKAKDRAIELEEQKLEQKNRLLHIQQKLQLVNKEVEEVERNTAGMTEEKLIVELEDDNKLKGILTNETLPKKVEAKRKEVIELEKVVSEPVFEEDLDGLRQQLADMNSEITTIMKKQMPGNDPAQDKLVLFKQQAAIIARKKEAAAETYKEVMDELADAERELKAKKEQLKSSGDDGVILSEEEFKRYVAKLRNVNMEFKRKKNELSALKAEYGVLSRTEELLKSRDENQEEMLELLEKSKGVHGFRETQEAIEDASAAKSELDQKTEKQLTEITMSIKELTAKIESKKASLAPLIKAVRPLRQQHQEVTADHAEKKEIYNGVAVGLQAQRAGLEREVTTLWADTMSEESQYHYLRCMLKSIGFQQERIAAEVRCYVSSEDKNKSIRDQYVRKIQEAEVLSRELRDKQKAIKETYTNSLNQVKMWKDLKKLCKVKKQCFVQGQEERSLAKAAEEKIIAEENRLVIT